MVMGLGGKGQRAGGGGGGESVMGSQGVSVSKVKSQRVLYEIWIVVKMIFFFCEQKFANFFFFWEIMCEK